MGIVLILLAAGTSRRLGSPKQLAAHEGTTLIRHAATIACETNVDKRLIVLGAHASRMKKELHGLPIHHILNPDWEEGIASSIRCGIRALLPGDEAALFTLCDQPRVTPDHLHNIIEAYRKTGDPVVASMYLGSMGVPALFDRSLFPELLGLKGDIGAKQIILEHAEEAVALPFPPAAYDIDTAEDLERM